MRQNTDDDSFYELKFQNLDVLRRFRTLFFLCSVYLFLLIYAIADWNWSWLAKGIFMFLYFVVITAKHMAHKRGIWQDWDYRLICWKEFYKSPTFYECYSIHKKGGGCSLCSISNGDVVLLSNNEYMKVRMKTSDYGYNSFIELSDLGNRDVYYSLKNQGDYYSMLRELHLEMMNKDNITIIRVYNRFGDLCWEQGNYERPSKKRNVLYKLFTWLILIFYFILTVMPILFLLSFNNPNVI